MWVLLLAAIFIAIAYFLPRTVIVERSAQIEAPTKLVYSQVIDLHQWDNWSMWNQLDPDMEIEYHNNGVGQGSGYSWQSKNKNVGNGTLKIISAARFDSIHVDLEFDGQGASKSAYYFKETDGQTDLRWTFSFDVGNNPLMRWMGLMIKKSVGKAYETGLSNLNAHCKVLKEEKEFVILLDEVDEFTYASIRKTVPFIEISLEMGQMYGEIGQYLAKEEVDMAGMPFSFYHLMDEDEIDLECGIPTSSKIRGNDRIIGATFPKTKCVSLDFYGDYNNLGTGHEKIQKWVEDHEFELMGPPMEFYLTDPGQDPNPNNWLTRICYPVN